MCLVPCTRIPRRQKPPLLGKLLHSMRLEPPARIPRKCQLSDLAVRWGCGPEGLSWAGSRSPPRTPAGGPEITHLHTTHLFFRSMRLNSAIHISRRQKQSFPRKMLHSMRLIHLARIPRKQKRSFPGKPLHSMRLVPCTRIPRNCQRSTAPGGRIRSAAGLCRSGRGEPVLRSRVCSLRQAGR